EALEIGGQGLFFRTTVGEERKLGGGDASAQSGAQAAANRGVQYAKLGGLLRQGVGASAGGVRGAGVRHDQLKRPLQLGQEAQPGPQRFLELRPFVAGNQDHAQRGGGNGRTRRGFHVSGGPPGSSLR